MLTDETDSDTITNSETMSILSQQDQLVYEFNLDHSKLDDKHLRNALRTLELVQFIEQHQYQTLEMGNLGKMS